MFNLNTVASCLIVVKITFKQVPIKTGQHKWSKKLSSHNRSGGNKRSNWSNLSSAKRGQAWPERIPQTKIIHDQLNQTSTTSNIPCTVEHFTLVDLSIRFTKTVDTKTLVVRYRSSMSGDVSGPWKWFNGIKLQISMSMGLSDIEMSGYELNNLGSYGLKMINFLSLRFNI